MTDTDWNNIVVEWNDTRNGYGPKGDNEDGTTNPFDGEDQLKDIFRRFCKKFICYLCKIIEGTVVANELI